MLSGPLTNFRYLSVSKIVEAVWGESIDYVITSSICERIYRFFSSGQQFVHFEHDHQCSGERERVYYNRVYKR